MTMPLRSTLLLFILSVVIPRVASHGYIQRVKIGGKSFPGVKASTPMKPDPNSPVRIVQGQDPIYGAQSPAVACGTNSRPGSVVAPAKAGDELEFTWLAEDGSYWPHNMGPLLTYMASCEGPCKNMDPTKARWFKIAQQGKKPGSEDWYQNDIYLKAGVTKATIPANIAPGEYLVRHEIIALHNAYKFKGAEFYPGCVQINISGSGTGVPAESDLVSFPGEYNDNDPSLYDKNKNYFPSPYRIPGPAIAKLVAQSQSSSVVNAAPDPDKSPSETSTPKPDPTDVKPAGGGGAKAKSCSKSKRRAVS